MIFIVNWVCLLLLFLNMHSLRMCVCQVYDGAYHALHHDLPETAELVLQDVITWITERLPIPSGP